MLSIRLRRAGTTKKPYFRVVVIEARSGRDSSFVENVGTYHPRAKPAEVAINKARLEHWLKRGARPSDTVIVDTAGRLHIDDDLMVELQAIKSAVEPSDLLYVADAMTGQDAIKSAGEFNRRIGVTGVVLTKLDGDARGGAALSVVSVVGVPIAFVGSGERLDDLELFHPDRIEIGRAHV